MPTMGKPISAAENKYSNVTIAKKSRNNVLTDDKEKERLLNSLTGYKPKNDLYADAKTKNKMGKDEFLKLLTHQLQNQDPLKPMEQKDMSAQLAQFSSLEQLTNLNTKFEKMQKNQGIEDKFFGASFLGKEIVTAGNSIEVKEDGATADVLYSLPAPAQKVLIRVFDQNNAMIGEMWKENVGRGSQNMTWDGVTLDGQPSQKGEYRVQVYAWDRNAEPLEVKSQVKGTVESVIMENGEAILMVDGRKVYLRDVQSFHMPGKSQITQAPSNLKGQQDQLAQALSNVQSAPARTRSAGNAATNLPVAQGSNTKVNLNKAQQNAGIKTYGKQAGSLYESDDLASVYDEEI